MHNLLCLKALLWHHIHVCRCTSLFLPNKTFWPTFPQASTEACPHFQSSRKFSFYCVPKVAPAQTCNQLAEEGQTEPCRHKHPQKRTHKSDQRKARATFLRSVLRSFLARRQMRHCVCVCVHAFQCVLCRNTCVCSQMNKTWVGPPAVCGSQGDRKMTDEMTPLSPYSCFSSPRWPQLYC